MNGESVIFDDSQKSSEFARYFQSVYTADDVELTPALPDLTAPKQITAFDIYELLCHWKKSSANTSPDLIPYLLLKQCSTGLALPISIIFNASLSSGAVPSLWRSGILKPLFKKGDRSLVHNYRPIALTCSLSKMCEHEVNALLLSFLRECGIPPPEQHGFSHGKSVTTNLVSFVDLITKLIDSDIPADAVYFDFEKAFDKVKHSILIRKLKMLHCPAYLVNWIINFLSHRLAQVQVGDCFSPSFTTPSGVPQGTVLGPSLFLIMVSDLPAFCRTDDVECFMFADDIKAVSSNSASLQTFIDKLAEWSRLNELPIAPHKCNVLHFLPATNPSHAYTLNGIIIPDSCTSVRDLGVTMSNNMSWKPHIANIVSKAMSALYCLFKAVKSRNPNILIKMYTVYVRPLVEFASPVFNPTSKLLIKQLESVQKRATRRIFLRSPLLRGSTSQFSYSDRCKLFGITSLAARRLYFDLKLFHQKLSGDIDCNFELLLADSKTRGRSRKVIIPKCRRSTRRSSFAIRASSAFTKLPRRTQAETKHLSLITEVSKLVSY
uniref:Reverse transcriptase domain-containing protein n=2 Tax=Panagrellus redivivus TaxID=6233 RepID=A0A7E4W555_PANRE